jgi:hypothetical protein
MVLGELVAVAGSAVVIIALDVWAQGEYANMREHRRLLKVLKDRWQRNERGFDKLAAEVTQLEGWLERQATRPSSLR